MPGIERGNEVVDQQQKAIEQMEKMMSPKPEAMSDNDFEMKTENQKLDPTEAKDQLTQPLSIAKKSAYEKELDLHTYSRKENEERFMGPGYQIIKVIELFGYEKDGMEIEYFGYLLQA